MGCDDYRSPDQGDEGNITVLKARFVSAAGLAGCLVVSGTGAASGQAEPVDCVSTASWQRWAADNSAQILSGHRHLEKAKRALKRGRNQRALSSNLYLAGNQFRSVSESPDGFASSFYHDAARDFQRAATAVNGYRINRASRAWSDGYWNLENAGNAIKMCVNGLEGR